MNDAKYLYSETTDKILKSFYEIYNQVGIGFEKSVYVKSLLISLKRAGLKSEINKEKSLYYLDQEVGKLIIDILVEGKILLKVSAEEKLEEKEVKILENELRMSEIEVGLLLNFGIEPIQRRKVNLK